MIGLGLAPLVLGLTAGLLALALAEVETRYMIAAVAVVAGSDILLLLGSWRRARAIMVVALALGLSVGLSTSTFLHTSVEGSYVPFVGGAEGITFSLSLLAALVYAVARVADGTVSSWRLSLPAVVPQVLFMAAGAASLLNASYPIFTWLEELRLVCLLGLCVVVMNLEHDEMTLLQRVMAASVLLQLGVVAAQFVTGGNLGLSVFGESTLIEQTTSSGVVARPTGTLGDPNIVGYFFEITGPVVLLLCVAARRPSDRLLFGAATAAAWAGTLLTLSRGAWIALPLCSMLALATYLGRRLLRPSSLTFLAIGGAIAACATVAAWPFLAERLFGDDGGSTGHRIPLAIATWQVLSDHLFFGVGLNNFALVMQHDDPTGYFRVFQHVAQVVHNLHLLVWTEVGTVGFVAYLALFGAAWRMAYRLRVEDDRIRALAFGAAFGLLAHFLHGFVDPGFKLSLVISQLITAQIGILGWLQLRYLRTR